MMEKNIRVEIKFEDMPKPMRPKPYFDFILSKLKEAGVPMDRGTITKRYDLENWGICVYEWTP